MEGGREEGLGPHDEHRHRPARGARAARRGAAVARPLSLVVFFVFVLASFADAARAAGPNALLVVVDTLRADRLGVYGQARDTSPALDAFARECVVFDRAYAAAPWTLPSVASILTGLPPHVHGVVRADRALPDSLPSLAPALRAHGYRTAAVVSNAFLDARHGFDRGFDRFVEREADVSSEQVTDAALEWLAEPRAAAPFFLFVHYFDPHAAYQNHAGLGWAGARGGRLRGGESMGKLRHMDLSPEERQFVSDLYDEEVRETDAQIGRLLDALRASGTLDRTIVIVTADHGEELLDHGRLGHARSLHQEVVHVPLLLRVPGRSAARVERAVSLVDLVPTLLDLLGVEQTGARSWLADGRGPVVTEVDYQSERPGSLRTHARAAIEGDWKLVEDRVEGSLRLHDLAADPDEREDVAARHPERVERLRRAFERADRVASGPAPARVPLSQRDRARLEELGYLEETGLEGTGLDEKSHREAEPGD